MHFREAQPFERAKVKQPRMAGFPSGGIQVMIGANSCYFLLYGVKAISYCFRT